MGSALFTKWSSAEDNGNCQGHYEERKRALCGTENVCHTRLYILIFSWDFRGCQTLPFLRGQTMPKFPKNSVIIPTRSWLSRPIQFRKGDLTQGISGAYIIR